MTVLHQIRRLMPMDGGLVLGPRPGKRTKAAVGRLKPSHVCTLLSERENPATVEQIASELGCGWIWLPVSGGRPDTLKALDIESMIGRLAAAIENESKPRIYLHCAAGIHRTGFFASILLRLQPMPADEVPRALSALRPVTAEQLGPERLSIALSRAEELLARQGL